MASHIEMKRLGDDPDAVQRLATSLLESAGCEWTDWERLFLEGMMDRRSTEPLSARQREILVDLRDGAQTLTNVHGFAISRLVRECWLNRFDLEDEADLAFIERLKARRADHAETPRRDAAVCVCQSSGCRAAVC